METRGQRIRRARQERGLTLEQLGKAVGTTKQGISAIERDETKNPEAQTIEGISRFLGKSVRWLLDGAGPEERSDDDDEWADVLASTEQSSFKSANAAAAYADAHKLKFRAETLLQKGLNASNVKVYYIKDDSMGPRLRTGDTVVFDETDTKPANGELFVVRWRNQLSVKRCELVDDIVLFRADQPDSDRAWNQPKRMDAQKEPVTVLGRIRWLGGWAGESKNA